MSSYPDSTPALSYGSASQSDAPSCTPGKRYGLIVLIIALVAAIVVGVMKFAESVSNKKDCGGGKGKKEDALQAKAVTLDSGRPAQTSKRVVKFADEDVPEEFRPDQELDEKAQKGWKAGLRHQPDAPQHPDFANVDLAHDSTAASGRKEQAQAMNLTPNAAGRNMGLSRSYPSVSVRGSKNVGAQDGINLLRGSCDPLMYRSGLQSHEFNDTEHRVSLIMGGVGAHMA